MDEQQESTNSKINSLMQSTVDTDYDSLPSAPAYVFAEPWEVVDGEDCKTTLTPPTFLSRLLPPKRAKQLRSIIHESHRVHSFLGKHPSLALACAATAGVGIVMASQAVVTGSIVYFCLPKVHITNNYYGNQNTASKGVDRYCSSVGRDTDEAPLRGL